MAIKPEDVLRAIAGARGNAICVPTMTTSPAWRTIAPDDLSIGCVGFMGGASSLGLGLALALPKRRVVVFDGDGSILMQLGSLATIAGAAPRNLTHLVFKNGVYHTSGAQEIPGGLTGDFGLMAKGAGYRNAYAIPEPAESKRRLPPMLTEEGPGLAELHTALAEKTPMTDPGGDAGVAVAGRRRGPPPRRRFLGRAVAAVHALAARPDAQGHPRRRRRPQRVLRPARAVVLPRHGRADHGVLGREPGRRVS